MQEFCTVTGRQGLLIVIDKCKPEKYLRDKSLVGLEGADLKRALKKPFVTTSNITYKICYDGEEYQFTIPRGFSWNGANVPSFAWVIIGQQKDPRFKLPSCVHDYICENHEAVRNNRYLSTLIFETLCEYFGRFNAVKRWAMFHSIDNYQKLCGWGKNG